MWKANNKHRVSVTVSNSESGETDRSSCGTTHTGARSRPRGGVPGAGVWLWHSKYTEAVPCPDPAVYRFPRCVRLAVCDAAPDTPNSTQLNSALWCDAVGFLRVHPGGGYQIRRGRGVWDCAYRYLTLLRTIAEDTFCAVSLRLMIVTYQNAALRLFGERLWL